MARYLVLWKANSSAWPSDPKHVLTILEGATHGGEALLKSGAAQDLAWLTAESGYAIFEAPSKDVVLGMVAPFFPYYSQDVQEIVPWDKGTAAILASARQAAAR